MQRASLPGAFSKKFSAMDWRTPSCSAFVIYLPDCYLTTGGSPACQPLCIICGPSCREMRSILCVANKVKCASPPTSFYINAFHYINACECANERQGETQKVAAQTSEQTNGLFPFLSTDTHSTDAVALEFGHSIACSCKAGPQPATSGMGWSLRKMMASACTGAMLGAGGVVVSSMLQVRRMPPTSQIVQAAAFMGTVLGLGSVVRG